MDKMMKDNIKLCEGDFIDLGFEKIPYFTENNALIYKLGRHRHLSLGCVGTPNEMLFVCKSSNQSETNITNLVCLHSYDYDGCLTIEKVKGLINLITGKI